MAVTLKNIYNKIKSIDGQQIELVAGEAGLNNVVRWVHIVEVNELTSFLEGNELIFTTGIAIKNNEDLINLVKEIYGSGASGLVINIGPYIESIPDEILKFCNERKFPLFEVPWQIYIGRTMRICAEEINKYDQKNMEISVAVQNAIYNSENYKLYIPILEKYGFMQEWSYCMALAEYVSETDEDVNEIADRVCKNIENSLVFYDVHAIVFQMVNQVAVLFVNETDSNVYEIMENIKHRYIIQNDSGIKTYIGIGRNTKSVRCIYKTYKIAHKVVELQKKKHCCNEIMSYRSMGFSKIFLAMDDTEIMNEYYSDILEPLVNYDMLNGTDFTDFLGVYFDCNSSVKETADRLFVHRNTVNYKLGKIQSILGCDLNDFYTKTELLIALKLKEML